ncbi:MAG: hypothetical protein GY931_01580 [Maribacter sp.]|nr:hypothetical protein [Maribacter sp.]
MLRVHLFFMLFLFLRITSAQKEPVKIITKNIPNRLMFYAINESTTDYDVMVTISGTNFRQSKAKPRLIRVPAASSVHMKTIMLIRGKKPTYTYKIYQNDSLSKRALKKPFEKIKINPKKQITLYIPHNCTTCDSINSSLTNGDYKYRMYLLSENENITNQLQRSFGANSTPVDSLKSPIINLGGKLYTNIDTYQELLDELDKE